MKNDEPKPWTIRELVEANDKKALTVNREYQRGEVWKPPQEKRLIDSGHHFFGLVKRTGRKASDDAGFADDARGAYRQMCAVWLMLFMERSSKDPDAFLDISNKRIDEFYYEHIDFDKTSPEAKRFEKVLQKGYELLFKPKAKQLKPHEALRVLLLIDPLLDGYAHGWESRFQDALDTFRAKLADDTKKWQDDEDTGPFWNRFGVYTRASSDRKDSIATRHHFFLSVMYEWLEPRFLDEIRIFGPIDKEYIYHRDKMHCQAVDCGKKVEWSDAEFHQGVRRTLRFEHRGMGSGLRFFGFGRIKSFRVPMT